MARWRSSDALWLAMLSLSAARHGAQDMGGAAVFMRGKEGCSCVRPCPTGRTSPPCTCSVTDKALLLLRPVY